MEFQKPNENGWTIYSKFNCINCVKTKKLLNEYEIIECDEYLFENKDEFIKFIKNLVGYEYKTFPMVFYNKKFIGGFNEVKKYLENNEFKLDEDF
jgi:glutaredoxin